MCYNASVEESKVVQLSPVSLAFLGDAVFSLYVRERLIAESDCKSGELTKRSCAFVKASAQSEMLSFIEEKLTDEEKDVVRRGRNTHTSGKAKNATLSDYRRATAFEALLGHLYLCGEKERLDEIMRECFVYRQKELTEK